MGGKTAQYDSARSGRKENFVWGVRDRRVRLAEAYTAAKEDAQITS
jgi:hypothetical protein